MRDDGIGIAADTLPTIFDVFTQVDRTRGRGPRAASASACRWCAAWCELHGGGVVARSAGEGHGSEFLVRLPADTTPTAAGGSAANAGRAIVRDATD